MTSDVKKRRGRPPLNGRKAMTPKQAKRRSRRLIRTRQIDQQRAARLMGYGSGGQVDDLATLSANGFRFGAICADPPWRYATRSTLGEGRSAAAHYDTMTIEELCALGESISKLAADDAVLFLWTLEWLDPRDVSRLIEAWGFKPNTTAFTWMKLNPTGEGFHRGMGHWTQANPERCLLATRGRPGPLERGIEQLIVAPVGEHSAKPMEAYRRIERLSAGPYLELFARRERQGWTTWGNELRFAPPVVAS